MTREQIEAWLAALDGVTSGPWMVRTKEHPFSYTGLDGEKKTGAHKETWLMTEWMHGQLKDHMPVVIHAVGLGLDGGPPIQFMRIEDADAAHIARCDPSTIRALCELALEGLELREDGAQLSANQCLYDIHLDEGGHPYCPQIERLRAENERLTEAVSEARIQIEYLHRKFQPTGSGEAVLTRLRSLERKAE